VKTMNRVNTLAKLPGSIRFNIALKAGVKGARLLRLGNQKLVA